MHQFLFIFQYLKEEQNFRFGEETFVLTSDAYSENSEIFTQCFTTYDVYLTMNFMGHVS